MQPILLLGERGTGKTWQLLRFADDAYSLNSQDPWGNGLAIFVRLSELVNLVHQSSAATPVLLHYILKKYADLKFPLAGAGLMGALLAVGHCVVCVDGFDEMDMLPTDAEVRARLTGLLLLLSKSTRFVLTCRPGHFESISSMLDTGTWGGTSIHKAFEVIELAPFDRSRKLGYIESAARHSQDKSLIQQLAGLVADSSSILPLQCALSTCAQHPAFLAHMTAAINSGMTTASELIGSGINKVFIEFNLIHARTAKSYRAPGGRRIDLSIEQRMELLGDLAWYMAERELRSVDLANLPPRIKRWYGIEDDVLERDLRSQTVFELAPEETNTKDIRGAVNEDSTQTSKRSRTSLARFTLRTGDEQREDVGESSVCGGFFLARHIAARLNELGPFGPLEGEGRLRFLGRVKLGPQAGALLKELLNAHSATCVAELGNQCWQLVRQLGAQCEMRVYSPWYRHLATNLAEIGAISRSAADALNPWTPSVCQIVRAPDTLSDYEMVLVPPIASRAGGRAFLLGVHEITNKQFLTFLNAKSNEHADPTIQGEAWTVGAMTIAGSGQAIPPSPNQSLSNEYHLFHWLPEKPRQIYPGEASGNTLQPRFLPPQEILAHPVSYVSWYVAAAYCDWLSIGAGRNRFYVDELRAARVGSVPHGPENADSTGYRLPTKAEWIWSAQAGHQDLNRPWDLFPFYCPDARKAILNRTTASRYQSVLDNFNQAQFLMRDILQDSAKTQSDVLNDEPNEFGVSGLIGNVREWCHDEVGKPVGADPPSAPERYILGATGYLGDATFTFEYATPLFPRNTNPDVGFRVARSLTTDELSLLKCREAEIGDLPENPPL